MYTAPATLPQTMGTLIAAIVGELRKLAIETREPSVNGVVLAKLNVAPAKNMEGLTVLADGANWNPGAGAGVYTYHSGAWNKLG